MGTPITQIIRASAYQELVQDEIPSSMAHVSSTPILRSNPSTPQVSMIAMPGNF